MFEGMQGIDEMLRQGNMRRLAPLAAATSILTFGSE